jgi:hypothetical protein
MDHTREEVDILKEKARKTYQSFNGIAAPLNFSGCNLGTT